MSRRRKKKEWIVPEIKTELVPFEYQCPDCKKKVTREFSLITPGNPEITNSFWCNNNRCGAIHCITYELSKRNGEPKMKITKFTSNGEQFTKRFKPIESKGEN